MHAIDGNGLRKDAQYAVTSSIGWANALSRVDEMWSGCVREFEEPYKDMVC